MRNVRALAEMLSMCRVQHATTDSGASVAAGHCCYSEPSSAGGWAPQYATLKSSDYTYYTTNNIQWPPTAVIGESCLNNTVPQAQKQPIIAAFVHPQFSG